MTTPESKASSFPAYNGLDRKEKNKEKQKQRNENTFDFCHRRSLPVLNSGLLI